MSTISKIKVGGTIYDITNYPVGSIYLSVNDTSPAELFGGTWEQIKDRFLLAVGDTYTAGSTGGEATHKLTKEEMPRHTHNSIFNGKWPYSENAINTNAFSGNSYAWVENDLIARIPTNDDVGGDQAHNNLPPYLAVYVWKRVA